MGSQGSLRSKEMMRTPLVLGTTVPRYRLPWYRGTYGTRYLLVPACQLVPTVPWTLDKLAQAGMYSYKLQSGTTEA